MTQAHKGTALVTGASSGIGALYADRLAKQGYDLILVARSADKLRDLARTISDTTGRSVEVVQADLADPAQLRRIEQVLSTDASITMLVNNAGVGATAPLLGSDIDAMQAMIALNVVAPTRLAYAVAPAFVTRGRGTIVNIASIVAIAPELLNGVYGGSKAFVLAFTRSLQYELADKGVRVQAVLPGATATDFWGIAGTPVEHLPGEIVMPATAMVDAALAGLELGEVVTIPSLPDAADWQRFEAARDILRPNLSRAVPAERYFSAA
ncbi:SDR family oxidoreductase [Bradyrhizobium sp. U87765 SZCCT0131]|uniref:SDR family NAD(P)-dependent oxidoreductase n=1 Tax=unclassified Bradyrhizobium TaxID=2631580 RepID=UPI001BA64DA6|nr:MULTISPECIES: SDR family oxidoreductase [unclassified Bradyrhizobium]MBR1221608.1 SDR family oxidoreductase [Bradyrhizobium sp. U87765 SZCCT0131]MBR1264469.1 SDR family oxidoreductase [Bradyrhizobium sp. U87765 SZCCT0134]MBR1304624.1 SDR family oxidoreductase [Bradyrhizobium sp. U87765 SZCCT0110]MBR1322519.1 SDR family oxidoreductase [Bradyrhizobium sp. U87765 SZCCT0109]MBR1346553.1 SDR family oxidoreductase [Bradyrhizobium sp. U87765 SZCCT0048]